MRVKALSEEKVKVLNEEITAAMKFLNNPSVSSELKGAYSCHLSHLLKIKRDLIEYELKQGLGGGELDNLDLIREEAFKVAQRLIADSREFDKNSTDPSALAAGHEIRVEGFWLNRGNGEVVKIELCSFSDVWRLTVKFYSEEEETIIMLDGVRVLRMNGCIDLTGVEQ